MSSKVEHLSDEPTSIRNYEKDSPQGSGAFRLLIYYQGGTEVVELEPDRPLTIGRGATADVRLLDRSISREHARFWCENEQIWLEDLASTNGTWLHGSQIQRGLLSPGEEVKLGEATVTAFLLDQVNDDVGPHTLHGHDRFLRVLSEELFRGRRFGRNLGVVMVQAALRSDGQVSSWIERFRSLLRPIDHLALYAPGIVELLLPEMSLSDATLVARRIADKGGLRCGVAGFPECEATADPLITTALHALQRSSDGQPVVAAESRLAASQGSLREVEAAETPVIASSAMQELYRSVGQFAQADVPVIICGETGAGKELIAKALHLRGPRKDKRLCSVNCGAIPRSLVESTLFGHERGAFTGADRTAAGLFEDADGGTVFLDEIGELPPEAQAALLRVLETKEIVRVGSSKPRRVNVRVIAATHRDLELMAKEGRFRNDLVYRLNAVVLQVPPLRERVDDIEPLASYFLSQANRANQRQVAGIEPDALQMLRAYQWPGNIRELRNVIERAVILANHEFITVDNLPSSIHEQLEENTRPGDEENRQRRPRFAETVANGDTGVYHIDPENLAVCGENFRDQMLSLERQLLVNALKKVAWNQTLAAKSLDLPLRTLVRKLKNLGIKRGPE